MRWHFFLAAMGLLIGIFLAPPDASRTLRADETVKPLAEEGDELRSALLRRQQEDQQARMALVQWMTRQGTAGRPDLTALGPEQNQQFQKLASQVKRADAENTKWLKHIVEKQGWPTISQVGEECAAAAWLLLQHADADPQFQRQCLDRMQTLPQDEVLPKNLAYLTDRVLLAEGKKQVYGTQFELVDGQWKPRPLEDEARVDQRRASVGLPTMSEYVEQLKQVYGAAKAEEIKEIKAK